MRRNRSTTPNPERTVSETHRAESTEPLEHTTDPTRSAPPPRTAVPTPPPHAALRGFTAVMLGPENNKDQKESNDAVWKMAEEHNQRQDEDNQNFLIPFRPKTSPKLKPKHGILKEVVGHTNNVTARLSSPAKLPYLNNRPDTPHDPTPPDELPAVRVASCYSGVRREPDKPSNAEIVRNKTGRRAIGASDPVIDNSYTRDYETIPKPEYGDWRKDHPALSHATAPGFRPDDEPIDPFSKGRRGE